LRPSSIAEQRPPRQEVKKTVIERKASNPKIIKNLVVLAVRT